MTDYTHVAAVPVVSGAIIGFGVCLFVYRALINNESLRRHLNFKNKISYTLLLICLSIAVGVSDVVTELTYVILFEGKLLVNNIVVGLLKIFLYPAIIFGIGIFISKFNNRENSGNKQNVSVLSISDLNATDEHLWQQASDELMSSKRREGLWVKCFAISDGDETKAKALYLRERVMELSKEVNSSVLKNSGIGSTRTDQGSSTSELGKKYGWLLIVLLAAPLLLIWILVPSPSNTGKDFSRELFGQERDLAKELYGNRKDEFGGIPVEKRKTPKEVPKEDLPWNQNWKSK